MTEPHARFTGSIPENYDRFLGPLFFEPHAELLAALVPASRAGRVLEVACGTGVFTRRLRAHLGPDREIVATDLNEGMIEMARPKFSPSDRVSFACADAAVLPFDAGAFDAVACQFGVMFFPDKASAFREFVRVLASDGTLAFNVWTTIDHNEPAHVVDRAVREHFADDPPTFYDTPFGYNDGAAIRASLEAAGFEDVRIDVLAADGESASVSAAVRGLIFGSPVLLEIESRDPHAAGKIAARAEERLRARFGDGMFRVKTGALYCTARKP